MAKKRIEILTEDDREKLQADINTKASTTDVNAKLDKKVDKVSGKGLSTNDFTNANKKSLETDIPTKITKLEGDIAQAGKVETVNSVKPDSQKNVELTGSNIKYKTGARENIGIKIDLLSNEVDTVKQSGVESNKILVDALNSKEVKASTDDNIRVNVEKVNSIHVGDYSIGDTLSSNQIVITNRFKTPKITINRDDIQCVTVLGGYVYMFTRYNLWKYDLKGSYIGSASLSNSGWSGICESSKNDIYLGRGTKLSKYNTDCKLMWEVDTQRQITALRIIGSNVVVGNENGYINEYNSSGVLVKKGSPGTSDIIDITSYKGAMYCTNSNYIMKLSADLSKYEEIGSKGHFIDIRDDKIIGLEMDSYGNYADFYKLDMSGTVIDRCVAHKMSRRNSVQIAYFEDDYIVYRHNGGVAVVDRDFNTIYTWSSTDSVNTKAISVDNGHIAAVSSDKLFILYPVSDSSIKIIK